MGLLFGVGVTVEEGKSKNALVFEGWAVCVGLVWCC